MVYQLKKKWYMSLRFKDKIDLKNLIYKNKTEGMNSKHFRGYRNSVKLFKNLRNEDLKPKEVFKKKSMFKSHQIEIKAGKYKSEERISALKTINHFLDLRKEVIKFFIDYSFCCLQLNTKENMEKDSRY